MSHNTSAETVLVTGGAGFIGSHLIDRLLAGERRVVCIDNFNDYYDPAQKRQNVAHLRDDPRVTILEADIRDRERVQRIFADHRPLKVAHLGAMAGVRYSIERAPLYVDVNIQGTINVLDAARQVDVQNVVFASTSSIYGETDQTPFVETQSTDRPLAPYPATKKAGEVLGFAYHNLFDLNFTALRFFTVYGPRVRPDMMAFIVMDSIVNKKPITLFDNGEMYRDWTYVQDIIAGVAAAVDTPLGYQIMNIGRGEPVHLGRFVRIIEALVGEDAQVENRPAPPSEPYMTYADVQKARRLLGYAPQTSIEEGLAQTWQWYKATHTQSGR